jgi:uncharacterized RDD family membrane protein YckC
MSDRFGNKRAGFWSRFGALLTDSLILGTVGWLVGLAFGESVVTIDNGTFAYAIDGGPAVVMLFVSLAYYIALEGGPSGATLGKRAVGIKVVDSTSGEAIGYGSAAGRWFGRLLSAAPLLLGYFWMLWDDEKQTWHDKLAHAVVIDR